jgi:hypothetical protein
MKFSFTLLLAATLLTACGARPSDETQVRELIGAVETGGEARDASDVLEHVARDYSDSQGFDRTQLQNFLRGYFLAHPRVELFVGIENLEFPVDGLGRARVDITSLPAGDRVALQVEFRREDDEWRVSRADRIRE